MLKQTKKKQQTFKETLLGSDQGSWEDSLHFLCPYTQLCSVKGPLPQPPQKEEQVLQWVIYKSCLGTAADGLRGLSKSHVRLLDKGQGQIQYVNKFWCLKLGFDVQGHEGVWTEVYLETHAPSEEPGNQSLSSLILRTVFWISLMVQWLSLHAPNARGPG